MGIGGGMFEEYRGKRVFLTGHTGFKGAWFTIWLSELGAIVKGYSLSPECDSLFAKVEKDLEIESEFGDIRDAERLRNSILDFQPDFVFHFAAQALVRPSYEDPLGTFNTNTIGTANLLDAIRFLEKACSVVVVTTDKVYWEKNSACLEDDRLGGKDPYSASKAAAEMTIYSYWHSYFRNSNKKITTARAGNVIGGGDFSKDRLIPDIIRSITNNEPIVLRNPAFVRPWQHVLDPLRGYLMAALHNRNVSDYDIFNFGPDPQNFLTVEQVCQIAFKNWKEVEIRVPEQTGQPYESSFLLLDSRHAKKVLGWLPQIGSKESVEKTAAWYHKFFDKGKVGLQLCIADLHSFSERTVL